MFHDFQELNDDDSWQEEIFNIMGKCARVIALLSPGYLETESCIEQYNMALCINRRSQETVVLHHLNGLYANIYESYTV